MAEVKYEWVWTDGYYHYSKAFCRLPVGKDGKTHDPDDDDFEDLYDHFPGFEFTVVEVAVATPTPMSIALGFDHVGHNLVLSFDGDYEEDQTFDSIPISIVHKLAHRLGFIVSTPDEIKELSVPKEGWREMPDEWVRFDDEDVEDADLIMHVKVKDDMLVVSRAGRNTLQTFEIPFEQVVLGALVKSGWTVERIKEK